MGTFAPNVINTGGGINPNISRLGTVLGLPARDMSNEHENKARCFHSRTLGLNVQYEGTADQT